MQSMEMLKAVIFEGPHMKDPFFMLYETVYKGFEQRRGLL